MLKLNGVTWSESKMNFKIRKFEDLFIIACFAFSEHKIEFWQIPGIALQYKIFFIHFTPPQFNLILNFFSDTLFKI